MAQWNCRQVRECEETEERGASGELQPALSATSFLPSRACNLECKSRSSCSKSFLGFASSRDSLEWRPIPGFPRTAGDLDFPTNHTDWHPQYPLVHPRLEGHCQGVSFASALTPPGYVYMWELYKTCSQLTPSWYPGPSATGLCSFSKTWSLFPSPWAMAGAGTCFQPENVAAATGTLWLTEQAQVHLLGDALLSPSPQATSADPGSRAAQLLAADTQGAPGAQPPLPTVGVWTSGWFATKQRLTDTAGVSVLAMCMYMPAV